MKPLVCQKKPVKYQVSGPMPEDLAEWDKFAAAWKKMFPGSNAGDTQEGEKHKCYIPIYMIKIKAPEIRNGQGQVTIPEHIAIRPETCGKWMIT